MFKDKILPILKKFIYILVISSFLVICFASDAGYFDHIKSRKSTLTTDQIAKFEEDVKAGKEIDINDYYIDKSEEYNNKFSKLGFTISTKVKNVTTSLLDRFFKFLNDFLNE